VAGAGFVLRVAAFGHLVDAPRRPVVLSCAAPHKTRAFPFREHFSLSAFGLGEKSPPLPHLPAPRFPTTPCKHGSRGHSAPVSRPRRNYRSKMC
jgi:hypothetical protein